jgi:hypothetical protein
MGISSVIVSNTKPNTRLADLLPGEEKAATKTFKTYKPGFLHIDTAQINLGKDKFYLFVTIDRATCYVCLELHDLCPLGTTLT